MTAQTRGWGPPCSGSIVTLVRKDGQRLPVRREIAVLVALLCDETERLGYDLVPGWSWGYACRKIRGSSSWSNHAWGLAVDLNAPENPMGPRTGKIRRHPKVIALWERYGFRWGGRYTGRADDMHMEVTGTPADAARLTKQAQAELGGAGEEDEDVYLQIGNGIWKVEHVPGKGGVRVKVNAGSAGAKQWKALQDAGVKAHNVKKTDPLVKLFPELKETR